MKPARKFSTRCAIVLTMVVITSTHRPTRADQDQDLKSFYGLLHAHTWFSDGTGTPAEAFAAAQQAGLDFFAVTPHNHKDAEGNQSSRTGQRKDGLLIGLDHDLYNATSDLTPQRKWRKNKNSPWVTETLQAVSVIQAANQATTPTFAALYGQEFSSISSGNHVNVFNLDDVLTVANGNYQGLFNHLSALAGSGALPVVQLNHPKVYWDLFYKGNDSGTLKKMRNDYGLDQGDLGPHFAQLVATADPYVCLIEMLSGPALSPTIDSHWRYRPHQNDYYFYLAQGFHISPTAGQDDHYRTWGTITDARTGVLSQTLSKQHL